MAGEPLYQRECKLICYGQAYRTARDLDEGTRSTDARTFTGLRTVFKIKKSIAKELNTAEISIYNLSKASRDFLRSKGTPVVLEAGYPGTTAIIFQGESQTIDHVHDGSNWVTIIKSGDGLQAYQFDRVAESFKAGTPKAAVFTALAKKLSVDAKEAISKAQLIGGQFTQGTTLFGTVAKELDTLLKGSGYSWSIQDGKLQVLADANGHTEDPPILLSATTGLIGSPSHGTPVHGATPGMVPKKPQVLKIKSLLQPGFRPGRQFVIDSKGTGKGTYIVHSMEHQGDTHGADWVTDIEAVPRT